MVRVGYARFNEGERIPSLEFWHADGVYVNSADDPDPGKQDLLGFFALFASVANEFERLVKFPCKVLASLRNVLQYFLLSNMLRVC